MNISGATTLLADYNIFFNISLNLHFISFHEKCSQYAIMNQVSGQFGVQIWSFTFREGLVRRSRLYPYGHQIDREALFPYKEFISLTIDKWINIKNVIKYCVEVKKS